MVHAQVQTYSYSFRALYDSTATSASVPHRRRDDLLLRDPPALMESAAGGGGAAATGEGGEGLEGEGAGGVEAQPHGYELQLVLVSHAVLVRSAPLRCGPAA